MKVSMKNYFLKRLGIQKNTAGFTLIELLVAMAISTIVIGVAGFGLITILDRNNKAEAETLRRTNLNRALDFIADEVRESESVSTTLPAAWTSWTVPTGYTGVLFLTKPGTPTQVAYYTRSSSGVVWQGPQVIYRKNGSDDPQALVDGVASASPTSSTPPCTGSGTASLGTVGFKVFVSNSRSVKVCLLGKLQDSGTYPVETTVFARSAP